MEATADKTTEQILQEMLTENTGRHMLDSGGAYGRNYDRNKGRDFESETETVLKWEFGGMDVTHNLYHWLKDRLDYAPKEDKEFHDFAELKENEDKYWPEVIEDFVKNHLCDDFSPEGVQSYNTYNGDDLLSQVIQYWYIDETYVILQVHGGCDVRGGYTAPRIFYAGDDGCSIYDNARASIYCTGREDNPYAHYWSTDDAYHWYDEDGGEDNLGEYERVNMEDAENFKRAVVKNRDLFEGEETTRIEYSHKGKLVVDEENNVAYCPKCGAPLKAGY